MSKMISVITVVKNARLDLLKTVESVNAQTCRDVIEYVVIDGDSTDGTKELVRQLAKEKKIDLWLSESDHGIYDAMNKGLQLIKGEWVFFLNSGDVFHSEDSLMKLWKKAQEKDQTPYGCSGVYGGCVQILPNGQRVVSKPLPPRKIYTRMVCSHQSLLLKTEVAREHPFDLSYRIAADHHQLMRLIYRFEPIWPINELISEVQLEDYTWAQLKKGLQEKRHALWNVTHNILFYFLHWVRFWGVGFKHLLRRLRDLVNKNSPRM